MLVAVVGAGSVAAEEAKLPDVSTAAVGVPRRVHVGLLASEAGLGSCAGRAGVTWTFRRDPALQDLWE